MFSPQQKQFEVSRFRTRRIDNKEPSFHWFNGALRVVGTKVNQCFLLQDSSNALNSWFSDGGSNVVTAAVSEKNGHDPNRSTLYTIHPPTVFKHWKLSLIQF